MKIKRNGVIGPKVKEARNALKLSQAEVAEALGYTTTMFVSMLENSAASVPTSKLRAVCELLGLDPEWMTEALIAEVTQQIREEVREWKVSKKTAQQFRKLRKSAAKRPGHKRVYQYRNSK